MMWLMVFVYILYIYFVILCLCEGVYLKPESDCCSLSSVLRLNHSFINLLIPYFCTYFIFVLFYKRYRGKVFIDVIENG